MRDLDRRRARIILVSMLVSFLLTRIWLHASPNSDFYIGGYNVHHLFTGILILVGSAIPLVLAHGTSRLSDIASAAFGIGLALTLDEWVYLIVTDGSNASYLLPVSLAGALVMVSLAAIYIMLLYFRSKP